MQATESRYYTPEEYLALEEAAEFRSEYIDGEIIPMTGGTTNHNGLAGNFYAALNFAFRQQDYEVFMGDVRLWIPKTQIYTYPDVMIIAGAPEYQENRKDTIVNPVVIVEVLSKSTQSYDRGETFSAYRTIPTFQEYVLLDQTQMRIEQFYKTGKKQGLLREYDEEDEAIALASVPFEINLEDIYSKVQFEAPEAAELSAEI
jgi:Uma2 family endonuclease